MQIFRPPRSAFGKWVEDRGIKGQDISKMSGVSDATISALMSGKSQRPTRLTARKLMKAIQEIDPDATFEDFWRVIE